MYLVIVLVLLAGVYRSTEQLIDLTEESTDDKEGCKLPAVPKNGNYSTLECQKTKCQTTTSPPPGSTVPSYWVLEYSCHKGYQLPKNAKLYHTRCIDGIWAPVPPVCLAEKIIRYIAESALPKPSRAPVPGGCLLPKYPAHGRYYTFSCTSTSKASDPACNYIPGTPVPPATTLTYACDHGYIPQYHSGHISQYTRCTNGSWDIKPPSCIKKCPALMSKTQAFRCFYGPREVECEQPSVPGTIATYSCPGLWSRDPQDTNKLITCLPDGQWTYQPPPCQQSCGISLIDSSHPRIIDGDPSPLGYFPWHAGVYHKAEGNSVGWNQFCGGTLIKPNVVLTAAFCVVQESPDRIVKVMSPRDLRVALGKYYRDWNKQEATEVKREVIDVKVPSDYRGSSTNFEFDIALLRLKEDAPLSKFVMSVCLGGPKIQQPTNNMLGYITGWGNSEQLEPSSTVLYCSWPFQDYDSCFHNVVKRKDGFISADKYCAGVEVHAAARKSIGGGFSFVINNKHHIFGILSSQVVRRNEIEYLTDLDYPVFTNISHSVHQKWISNTIDSWMKDATLKWLDT